MDSNPNQATEAQPGDKRTRDEPGPGPSSFARQWAPVSPHKKFSGRRNNQGKGTKPSHRATSAGTSIAANSLRAAGLGLSQTDASAAAPEQASDECFGITREMDIAHVQATKKMPGVIPLVLMKRTPQQADKFIEDCVPAALQDFLANELRVINISPKNAPTPIMVIRLEASAVTRDRIKLQKAIRTALSTAHSDLQWIPPAFNVTISDPLSVALLLAPEGLPTITLRGCLSNRDIEHFNSAAFTTQAPGIIPQAASHSAPPTISAAEGVTSSNVFYSFKCFTVGAIIGIHDMAASSAHADKRLRIIPNKASINGTRVLYMVGITSGAVPRHALKDALLRWPKRDRPFASNNFVTFSTQTYGDSGRVVIQRVITAGALATALRGEIEASKNAELRLNGLTIVELKDPKRREAQADSDDTPEDEIFE